MVLIWSYTQNKYRQICYSSALLLLDYQFITSGLWLYFANRYSIGLNSDEIYSLLLVFIMGVFIIAMYSKFVFKWSSFDIIILMYFLAALLWLSIFPSWKLLVWVLFANTISLDSNDLPITLLHENRFIRVFIVMKVAIIFLSILGRESQWMIFVKTFQSYNVHGIGTTCDEDFQEFNKLFKDSVDATDNGPMTTDLIPDWRRQLFFHVVLWCADSILLAWTG